MILVKTLHCHFDVDLLTEFFFELFSMGVAAVGIYIHCRFFVR